MATTVGLTAVDECLAQPAATATRKEFPVDLLCAHRIPKERPADLLATYRSSTDPDLAELDVEPKEPVDA